MNNKVFSNTVLALLKTAPGIGRLQLRKALLIVDAMYHSYYGETLTGITYIKHRHGPVPDYQAHAALFDMELRQIDVIDEPVGPKTKNAHYAIVDPDYSVFNAKAMSIINSVAGYVKGSTASKLSNLTHDSVYDSTNMGEAIPITSFYSIELETAPWTRAEKADAKKALEEELKTGGINIERFCVPVEAAAS